MSIERHKFSITASDGWFLDIEHFRAASNDKSRKPVVMFPGYCMNSFVLGYHPRGTSLAEYFASRGHDVFTANLRGQGGAYNRKRKTPSFGFEELSLDDVPLVIDVVRERTGSDSVIGLGASLGATFLFAYLAHNYEQHHLSAMIALGGPLRWDAVHPMVKAAFFSSRVAALIRVRGTRSTAQKLLPIVKKMPSMLSIYMNTERIDLSKAHVFVQTVDDPVPYLNGQIATWVKQHDLTVKGRNVTHAMSGVDIPLLCVAANRDGIVPVKTVSATQRYWGGQTELMVVGDDDNWFAHADLFINDEAQSRIFEPCVDWLDKLNS